jgi:hypothetical protein
MEDVEGDGSGDRQRRFVAFAEELHRLRVSVGSPSFRKMASLSGCISHTTLAEAEKGLRFPSWETTREFVKACRGDEVDWRGRWESTRKDKTPEEPVLTPRLDVRETGRRRFVVPVAAGLVILGIVVLVTVMRTVSSTGSAGDGELAAKGALIEGDHARFIQDVTIPDESQVQVGEEFVKVWEIMNAGKVTWRDRYLQREDLPVSPDTCQTPERVAIGDTLPNERVMVSVRVTAPDKPTTCKIDWKMVDERGRQFLPTSRPVYFLVYVIGPPDATS